MTLAANTARASESQPVTPVAVIDVGTSFIRMAVAQVDGEGRVEILDSLSQGVSLGKDTFTRGEIAKSTIEECVRVLKAYRRKLAEYGISSTEHVQVVATSAVREALNKMAFVDRIYVATGLTVEPIDEAEVHRVTYRSIQPLLKAESRFADATTIISEVGGGSTELLIIERGDVQYSHSYRLGSLRLRQSLQGLRASQTKLREIMDLEIRHSLEDLPQHLAGHEKVELLASGGDIRLAARELIPDWKHEALGQLDVDRLRDFAERILAMSDEAVVRRFHLTLPDAETLGPALLVYLELARLLGVSQINVSTANLRDGLLREMGDRTIWTEDFRNQIVRSAIELGRKYQFDEPHARHVADLGRALFEFCREDHGLDDRHELILYLAALLHEVGGFISQTSIHKHSMYVIQNSDLFGMSANDVMLVSLVARYHRRASPKPSHAGFSTLSRDGRVAVAKLAAILRIAIALDASRTQRVRDIQCRRDRSRIIITVPQVDDLSVEQLALRRGRTLFEEVYGVSVLLRTAGLGELKEPSAQL